MRDEHDVAFTLLRARLSDDIEDAAADVGERLAPRRLERVAHAPPHVRAQDDPAERAGDAFQRRSALDQPGVGADVDAMRMRDQLCRLLSTLQRARPYRDDVSVSQVLRRLVGLSPAAFGQVVARQVPVDHSLRVLDLTVANEMDRLHPRQTTDADSIG